MLEVFVGSGTIILVAIITAFINAHIRLNNRVDALESWRDSHNEWAKSQSERMQDIITDIRTLQRRGPSGS